MSIQEWPEFLREYAQAVDAKEWPGSAGAREEQLLAAEKRLKVSLPPSYRAFLAASNGWRQASRAVPVLRSAQDIRWFGKEHADWVAAYVEPQQGIERSIIAEQDYFNYALENSVNFDVSHLKHCLCVSDEGDSAVLLLNPMVVWPEGEWEAWFFANWLPGATRYRSFEDWMRQELAQLLDESFEHRTKPGELPTVYLDGPTKAKRRIRRREELPAIHVVLDKLRSKKNRERVRAAQQLSRLGGKEAVDALVNALKNDPDADVRCEAAEGLGRLGAREAVDELIAAIDDPGVNTTAIHALGGIEDERAAQCLLKLVEEAGMYATSAVHPLAQRADARAVKHLVRALTSRDPRDDHIGNIAGRLIAQFQEAGYRALEPLMDHADKEIRSRAAIGMGDLAFGANEKSVKIKARQLLQCCVATEADTELRRLLEILVNVGGNKKGD